MEGTTMAIDIPSERALLLASRATEVTKLQVLQTEVDRYERDAIITGVMAPGYSEAKYGRDVQQRAITQLDGRIESLDRRRTNEINHTFRSLVLKKYPDAHQLLDIATLAIDPDGAK
jgi:hypothetical protein